MTFYKPTGSSHTQLHLSVFAKKGKNGASQISLSSLPLEQPASYFSNGPTALNLKEHRHP